MTPPRFIGRKFLRFSSVASTNDVAAEHALDPANEGLVVLADEQTAGRGRQGRSWTSPPGANVLLSALLFPPVHLRRPVVLTVLAAVAVGETITDVAGLDARIKWPNDLLVNGKKVCGILVEQGHGAVIGIGLNVNVPPADLARAGLDAAASLFAITGQTFDRDRVVDHLLARLDAHYAGLLAGEAEETLAAWRKRLGCLNADVLVETREESVRGRLLDLDFDQATLRLSDGQLRGFAPETILHLHRD